ncbi:MAG TPA: LamG domain-containing protein, partial [Candidatus Marinimicrobia bacterium]|nr:LamG domain-containing protein [Candidatus Neomarinimicrobiota bacterium]HIB60553.1 LamG domain-containing protein [Candidatus Neomarinimicrobiota bacterium]
MSVSRSQNMVGVSLMFNRGLLISLCLSISLGQEYSYFFENDDLEIPDNNTLNPSSGITIEAWVSPSFTGAIDDFTGIAHYLTLNGPTQESGFSLMYYDGAWRFIVSVGSGDHDIYGDGLEVWPGIDLDIDTWTHIAGTYDNTSNEAKIYKNGQLQETFTTESGDLNWDFINIDYMIGKGVDPGSNESFFEGNIDEIRLWDVARDETALIADMNGPLVGNENNLIGYWNFDEDTTDATINDITANNNDGTLNQVDGYWDTDVFTELQCEDYVISELPFYHSDTT